MSESYEPVSDVALENLVSIGEASVKGNYVVHLKPESAYAIFRELQERRAAENWLARARELGLSSVTGPLTDETLAELAKTCERAHVARDVPALLLGKIIGELRERRQREKAVVGQSPMADVWKAIHAGKSMEEAVAEACPQLHREKLVAAVIWAAERLYDNIAEFDRVTDGEFLDDLEKALAALPGTQAHARRQEWQARQAKEQMPTQLHEQDQPEEDGAFVIPGITWEDAQPVLKMLKENGVTCCGCGRKYEDGHVCPDAVAEPAPNPFDPAARQTGRTDLP